MPKNKHNKAVGSEIDRTDDRIKQTGEVFTPMELCYQMVDEIPEEIMKNPESTFLDNSAGSGNFPAALLDRLVNKFGHNKKHVLDHMLYVVEFMEDNHKELCERLGVPTDHPHYVRADALTYNYSFGEPIALEKHFRSKDQC